MNLKEFGIYFSKLRESKGYRSQRELAVKSGVSHSTINRIESGSHKVSPDNLKILAKHLNTDYRELMTKAGYLDNDNISEEVKKALEEGIISRDDIDAAEARIKDEVIVHLFEQYANKYNVDLSDPAFHEIISKIFEIISIAQKKKSD